MFSILLPKYLLPPPRIQCTSSLTLTFFWVHIESNVDLFCLLLTSPNPLSLPILRRVRCEFNMVRYFVSLFTSCRYRRERPRRDALSQMSCVSPLLFTNVEGLKDARRCGTKELWDKDGERTNKAWMAVLVLATEPGDYQILISRSVRRVLKPRPFVIDFSSRSLLKTSLKHTHDGHNVQLVSTTIPLCPPRRPSAAPCTDGSTTDNYV